MIIGKSEKDFQELYRTQGPRVRRLLTGMVGNSSVADELTQESFIKAWKGLPSFQFRSTLATWVYQVAINTGLDWLRTHKNTQSLGPMDERPDENKDEKEAVASALLELEENMRALLLLHYYEGLDLKEIGLVLKIPEGTVKSRLHTAKGKLKEVLLVKGFDL